MTAPPAAPGRLWDPGYRLRLIGVVSLVTVVAVEAMAIVTIMPTVEDELGDIYLYGWAFSAFSLGHIVGTIVGGRSADRMPLLVPLMSGLTLFGAGLAVGGVAPSMWVLVAGRTLQGLGGGAVVAVAYVCVGRGFPESLRPGVFAVMSTAWVLPSLISPLAASLVADAFGWRWVFLGLIPVTAAVGVLGVRSLRDLSRPVDHDLVPDQAHVLAVVRLAVGTGLVLAGLSTDSVWLVMLAVAVGGVVALPAFVSLTPPGTLRAARGLPAAVITRGALTFAFFAADSFISLAITDARGSTTTVAAIVLATSSFTWTAGAWIQARRAESWGPSRLVALGGACLAVGLVGYALSLWPAVPLWCWGLASATCGLGMGLAYAPLSLVTLAQADPDRQGEATSSLQMTDMLGNALGAGIGGALVTLGATLGQAEWVALAELFGVAALMAVIVAVLAPRLRAPDRSVVA